MKHKVLKASSALLLVFIALLQMSGVSSISSAQSDSTPPPATPPPATPVPDHLLPSESPGLAPQAVIAADCESAPCSFFVTQSADDAGMDPGNCSYSTTDNEIYFGNCGGTSDIISGFHFSNVTIPPGATILEATLKFTVDGAYTSEELTTDIFGEATDNSQPFDLVSRPDTRPLTSSSVQWFVPISDPWYLNETRQTPDLTNIIQEIVNRPNWVEGNGLSIITKNAAPSTGQAHRRVVGIDRPPTTYSGEVPQLLVRYRILTPVSVQILDDQNNPVSSLSLNSDGWPTPNPLTVKVALGCPADGLDCNFNFALNIDTGGIGRFYIYDAAFDGATCSGDYDETFDTYDSFSVSCSTISLLAGQSATYTWKVWIQPSVAATLNVEATYGVDSDTAQASIPLASINPIMFLPGTGATLSPSFNGSLWAANEFLYNTLFEELEKMGYEHGKTLFQFPWDWLTSHLTSVGHLRDVALQNAAAQAQLVAWVNTTNGVDFDLVGHSAGGLIARAYVQSDTYNNNVNKLITIGTPWRGLVGTYETWEGLESILMPATTFLADNIFIRDRARDAGYFEETCIDTPRGRYCVIVFTDEARYEFTHDPINGVSNLPELLVPFTAAADPYLQNTDGNPPPIGNYPFGRQANTLLDCQADVDANPGLQDPYEGVAQSNWRVPSNYVTVFHCLDGPTKMDLLNTRIGDSNVYLIYAINPVGTTFQTPHHYEVDEEPYATDGFRWRNGTVYLPAGRKEISNYGDKLVQGFSANPQGIWRGGGPPSSNIFEISKLIQPGEICTADHGHLPVYNAGINAIAKSLTGFSLPFLPNETCEQAEAEATARLNAYQAQLSSGLLVYLSSPAELTITDPQGRRLGYDPATGGEFTEIPFGVYTHYSGSTAKSLLLLTPDVGDYSVTVTGTGAGSYTLTSHFEDANGVAQLLLQEGTTSIGQTDTVVINVPVSSGDVPSPPHVNAGPNITTLKEEPVSFNGTIRDINPDDTFTIGWDFGDGQIANDTLTPTHTYDTEGTYNVTLTVTDSVGFEISDTAEVTVTALPYSVFGLEGTWLKVSTIIHSGDVGTNAASAGPFLTNDNVEMLIENQTTFLDPASRLLGDSVILNLGVEVYDVYYNELDNQGTILGSQITPLTLPLTAQLPSVPPFPQVARQDVVVATNGSVTLSPGDYGLLDAGSRSTLVFTGGTYTFTDWNIGRSAKLHFQGPSEVLVDQRIFTSASIFIGPEPGSSGFDASDIELVVTGLNIDVNSPNTSPRAAEFGSAASIQAQVYVPNGTLWIGKQTVVTGTLIAKWVILENDVEVIFDSD